MLKNGTGKFVDPGVPATWLGRMGRQKMMDTLAPVLPSTAKHLHQGATEMKAGNQERDVYIMYIYMYIKVIKLYIYIYIYIYHAKYGLDSPY